MVVYKQRDVVFIKFPYTNLEGIKQRPAVIISADWYNDLRDDVIVLAITSKLSGKGNRDSYIVVPSIDKACGLKKSSIIKMGKVMTLHKGFITERIGELPVPQFRDLIKGYMDVLGYPEFMK